MRRTMMWMMVGALIAAAGLPVAAAHWRGNDIPSWDAPHEHVVHAGIGTCVDLDGAGFVDLTPIAGADTIELDYGVAYAEPLAERFRHGTWPVIGTGDAPNPTGSTGAADSVGKPYPQQSATGTGMLQSITKVGLDATGTGASANLAPPGPDIGDNDFEFGYGVACHTYAIDSGDFVLAWDGVAPPTAGRAPVLGGASFNDPRAIGHDGNFDTGIQSGLYGNPTNSFLIDAGSTIPETPTAGTAQGFLMHPVGSPLGPVDYSLCHMLVGAGCTNIPDSTTGGVYASLQDCVWTPTSPDNTHAASGKEYRGEQAQWGHGPATGRTCWPERLAMSSFGFFIPESLVKDEQIAAGSTVTADWNPDHLPATYENIESVTVFFNAPTHPLVFSAVFHEDPSIVPGPSIPPTHPTAAGGGPLFVAMHASPPELLVTPGWSCVTTVPWTITGTLGSMEVECTPPLGLKGCQNPVLSVFVGGLSTNVVTAKGTMACGILGPTDCIVATPVTPPQIPACGEVLWGSALLGSTLRCGIEVDPPDYFPWIAKCLNDP